MREHALPKPEGQLAQPQTPDLNATLRALAERYAELAQALLGDNLTSVVLFGSVARAEARPESDIDLLVICRCLPAGAFLRRAVLAPIRERLQPEIDRLWAQGCYTDFAEILKTEAEAQHTVPFYLDLTEDAVLLFDRSGFFADVLERLRARLRTLGAQRRRLGDVRYWDLKPNCAPGEVIEL